MSHFPRHAAAYLVHLPDEDAAHEVARLLTERGHTAVSVREGVPDQPFHRFYETSWKVTALDAGPYPDDDVRWWTAVETRIVKTLAAERGGSCTLMQAVPETARALLPDGADDRPPAEARAARLAALSAAPARAPRPVITYRLDRPASGGPSGTPVPLPGLDDVDWPSLKHAYGSAEDTPDILRAMAANDEGWDEATFEYFSAIVHQETCYSATPPTIPFLARMACDPVMTPEYRLELLADLAYIASFDPSPAAGEEPAPTAHAARACREVVGALPALLSRWPEAAPAERAWLIVLGALSPAAAAPLLPEFEGFRRGLEGPSPALDLALALAADDEDRACGLVLDCTTWDENISWHLADDTPPRCRNLTVLVRLAVDELPRG
ncbi:hypothetical protein ACFQU9_34415 [Actinomadura namibiensis]|uniref:Uncharacterized protein n=1 Tax=Actinomadura namibiensis TaxID=182080 RepID=A0A7W3QRV9_ACTNM|nr:hypothetical protein [Actinomadura namibiensis]MBA8957086.1 hypothetical protein [Actinomadura namibiensis]